jgi:hypothetical protein
MSNRLDYYFRQRVTEAELDLGFTDLEQADQNLALDLGFTGVIAGAVVSQHASPNLTIDVSGPGAILDQLGQRIFFAGLQNVNVALDSSGVTTQVSTTGNQKIVSVFVMFDRALSDPRVDGNSLTVFFQRAESFKFIVVQGGETRLIDPPSLPPLRNDAILLADITRRFNQSQVLAADISIARRQDAFVLSGSPRSIRRGRTIEAVSDLLSFFNAHVSDLAAQTANNDGAKLVGAQASGSLPAGTVRSQLDSLATGSVRTNVTNVFTAAQTVNGASGDTNAALLTTSAPSSQTSRKLLWEITGATTVKFRLYSAAAALEITANARWTGTQWVKDEPASPPSKLEFSIFFLRLKSISDLSVSTFTEDFWANQIDLTFDGHGFQSINASGEWISAGQTKTVGGWQGQSPSSANATIGTGVSFKKTFPVTPSSGTAVYSTSANINVPTAPPPGVSSVTNDGAFVACVPTTVNANTKFFATVTV